MAPLIEIRDLRVEARGDDGQVVEIVKGVSFAVERGEVMGLIGESGSGKTTIALALLGYARFGCRLSGGSVRVGETEVLGLEEPACASCAAGESPISRRVRPPPSIRPAPSCSK